MKQHSSKTTCSRKPLKKLIPLLCAIGVLSPLATPNLPGEEPRPPSTQPETVRHPQIGVCTHMRRWKDDRIISLLANSGVTWIRDDYYWRAIETTKGVYALPEDYRKWLDAAHAAGLKVIAIFDQDNKIYAPDIFDPEAFTKAVAWFAKETRGKVQVIEIINEPFGSFGFREHYGGTWNGVEADGSVSPWVGKHLELLNKSAKAIKAVNPEVKVIGAASIPPATFRQIPMGIAPEVDGLTDHPYSPRSVPEIIPFAATEGILKRDGIATADARGTFSSFINNLRKLSEQHHGPKELWLTEWGWSTYHESKAGQQFAGFTERAQAKYILRRLMECVGLGVDVTVIYDFKDDGPDPYWVEHHYGLIDNDFKPKLSYGAVQRFCRTMVPYKPEKKAEVDVFIVDVRPDTYPITWDGSKLKAPEKVSLYQFSDKNGKPMIALWSPERADGDLNEALADVEINTGHPVKTVKAYNIFSDASSTIPSESKGNRTILKNMRIPDSPVLLTFE